MASRQERKERTSRQRKQQILNAALKVFSEKGFAGGTTAEIARTAGIAEGTIYRYFGSKRELLISLIDNQVVAEFPDQLPRILSQPTVSGLEELFSGWLNKTLDRAYDIQPIVTEVQRDPEFRERYIKQILTPIIAMNREYLQTQVNRGSFRPVNNELVARIITAIFLGLAVLDRLEGMTGLLHKLPQEETRAEIINLLLHGISAVQRDSSGKGLSGNLANDVSADKGEFETA